VIKALINAKVIIGEAIYDNQTVLFDKTIAAVDNGIDISGCEIIDARGAYVSAGFIDLHIHGSGGADVMDATPEALDTICRTLIQTGTTAFLATTMTMAQEAIDNAIDNVRACQKRLRGAQIVGVHLEGPFINPKKQGAQDARFVQKPTYAAIEKHMDIVKMITLAPEMEGAETFIGQLRKHHSDVVLSIGHSEADYDTASRSFEWGISHATHLFNAMPPLHHRSPGIVGAVFSHEEVTCDVIADLVHLHPAILKSVWQQKGKKMMLITDAMRAGCMKNGEYDLGGQRVFVAHDKASLENGTLAGSVLKMNEAVRNMVCHAGMRLPQAIAAVTQIPAKKLNLNKGTIAAGYDADMVFFDEDFSIITTIVAGSVQYQRSK